MLAELLKDCRDVKLHGSGEVDISEVSYDSRSVVKGSLYVAITGLRTDGRRFAADAVNRGAAAVAAQGVEELPQDVPLIDVANARRFLAEASAAFTGYPDREMMVLGVTGTNGKTTVTYLLESIMREAGRKTAIIGTTGFFDGDNWEKLAHTTPESVDLWNILKRVKENDVETVAVEISSHAIAFDRTWGLDVNAAIFTNLTQDHLDFHKDMQDYKETKFRLFSEIKPQAPAIINADDPAGRELLALLGAHPSVSFSIESKGGDMWVEIEEATPVGSAVVLHYQGLALPVFIKLPGLHNVSNLAAAAGAALALGIEPEPLKQGVESLTCVPGRMEPVPNDRGFFVFVDYAHTPDALAHLISAARSLTKHRVITLLGCGGDRDRDKRPKMGRIASELSDFVFVTSDNPRTENPQGIIDEILAGMDSKNKQVIADRRQAIFDAVALLEPGDVLLVAGKGHEDYQILGAEKIHFDDREVVKEALDALA